MKRLAIAYAVLGMLGSVALAADYVWVEGEKPSSSNFEWKATNWPGNERFSAASRRENELF